MSLRRLLLFSTLLLLSLTGCLPTACNRSETRALFPSDSLSRALAQALPVDTLALAWTVVGGEDEAGVPLSYPRTVRFDTSGGVAVSDAQRNSVFFFDVVGTLRREVHDEAFQYPYLSGWRGDTLLVFNPTDGRIDFLTNEGLTRAVTLAAERPRGGGLTYTAATDTGFFAKVLGDGFDGYLARFDDTGREAERRLLPGPTWRYAGLLRTWDDAVVSLSGYRPAVDVLTPGGTVDSVALVGFDSPMLARSRLFLIGETHEAPLLTASAAPAGELLFVLNLRPGWLRIDAFDRNGHLQHQLVQPNPGFFKDFYPIDLAARRTADGYAFAVLIVEPQPQVSVYTWEP